MLDDPVAWYLGVLLKQLAHGFVDPSQVFLVPSSVPLGKEVSLVAAMIIAGVIASNTDE